MGTKDKSKQFYAHGLILLRVSIGLTVIRLLTGIQGMTPLALLTGLIGILMTLEYLRSIYYKSLNASTLALQRVDERCECDEKL